MDPDFWRQRWQLNQIGFHEPHPNRHLQQFAGRLPAASRVLVPFCGKSADLMWLATHEYGVTGVEIVEQAADAFFQENGLPATRSKLGPFARLAAPKVEILVGDFYDLPQVGLTPFESAYDRAALVAVAPEDRQRYVRTLLGLMAPGARLLLVTFSYDSDKMNGPPFSVGEEQVRDLFAAECAIERLADDDILDAEPRFRERGLDWLREQAWLVTRR